MIVTYQCLIYMSGIQTTRATIDVQKYGSIEGCLRLPSETPEAIFQGKRQNKTTTDLPALIVLNFYTDLINSSPENFVCTRQIKEG